MIRYNLYLNKDQDRKLRNLEGTLSEHIRRAIDEYLKKHEKSASTSPSLTINKKDRNA